MMLRAAGWVRGAGGAKAARFAIGVVCLMVGGRGGLSCRRGSG